MQDTPTPGEGDDVREADRRNGEPDATSGSTNEVPPGRDTPTGTDPDAKYEQPGYEDKSFGQAVNQDQELADELLEETGGDEQEAAERFEEESAGAPTIERQQS